MDCMVQLKNGIQFSFIQNKHKQNILIRILLSYTEFDLLEISSMLRVSLDKLINVMTQQDFLNQTEAAYLGELFLLTLSAPGRI